MPDYESLDLTPHLNGGPDVLGARHFGGLRFAAGGLEYIGETAVARPPGSGTHRHGEEDQPAYPQRPFLEARDAILSRMR